MRDLVAIDQFIYEVTEEWNNVSVLLGDRL